MDRDQLDHRRPCIDNKLERIGHLTECSQDLLQNTKSDGTRSDRRHENKIADNVICLKIETTADIEIHVMEIQPEIIAADIVKQLTHGQWLSTLGIIFAIDKLFPESCLNPLIAELEPRQFDPDQGKENSAEN